LNILIDECVPSPLARLLVEHTCISVEQCGWRGIKNGELLALAENQYDLFLTADQNIKYQQNLGGFTIAVMELSTNDFNRLSASLELIRSELEKIGKGTMVRVSIP